MLVLMAIAAPVGAQTSIDLAAGVSFVTAANGASTADFHGGETVRLGAVVPDGSGDAFRFSASVTLFGRRGIGGTAPPCASNVVNCVGYIDEAEHLTTGVIERILYIGGSRRFFVSAGGGLAFGTATSQGVHPLATIGAGVEFRHSGDCMPFMDASPRVLLGETTPGLAVAFPVMLGVRCH